MAWSQALAEIPVLPEEHLRSLAKALPSPSAAHQFARFTAREPDPAGAVRSFLDDVAESGETLEEWLAALATLAAFLDQTEHRPGLIAAAGYLHCCASLIDSGPRYATFAGTVQSMLELYGYQGPEET